MFEFLAPKFKLNVKYLALSIRNALENFKDFFWLETQIFQVIFKKVLKSYKAALMTVQFIGSSTLDACQDGAT
mgnify:FL=1